MSTILKNEILWAKVKENAIIPTKRDEDAGYDIYPCFDEENLIIESHETKLIPTGIASAFSSDYVLILKERGSTGTKGIGQRCGVIDSGFRGEYFVPITNHNNKPIVITKEENTDHLQEEFIVYPYSKAICQGVVHIIPKLKSREVPYNELKSYTSERGDGKIGSSGK